MAADRRKNGHCGHVSGSANYSLEGIIEVVIGRRSYPVVMPNDFRVSFEEYPEREAPNAKAAVRIFGTTRDPERRAPSSGASRIGIGWAGSGGSPRPPSPDRCGGIGWHFELDEVQRPRLSRLSVTIPRGRGNGTWGVIVDPPIPWVGPTPGSSSETIGRSGGFHYRVTVSSPGKGQWRWEAQPLGASAPWLERFVLAISGGSGRLETLPEVLTIRYWSEAREEALRAELVATRNTAR